MKKIQILFLIMIVFLFCSCNSSKEETFRDGRYGYDSTVISIDGNENDYNVLKSSVFDGDDYYFSIDVYETDENYNYTDVYSLLYCVSSNGDLSKSLRFSDNDPLYSYYQTKIQDYWVVQTEGNSLSFYEIDSLEVEKKLSYDFSINQIIEYQDNMVLLSDTEIILSDLDGQILSCVNIDGINFYNVTTPCFEQDDNIYVMGMEGEIYKLYKVDFASKKYEAIFTINDLGGGLFYSGKYFINSNGEYSVDINNQTLKYLADWNSINVFPGNQVINATSYCPGNDESFVKINEMADGSIDIIIFTYNHDIDYSDTERIVIGGYSINNDLLLLKAQYEFNSTHNDYRICIDDYSDRFGFDNYQSAQTQTAELIQYFNEGNAPDIYYGFYFDYDYFYDNEMTQDMRPYIEADGFEIQSISPNIRDIWTREDGSIYMIFSSYYLNGNVARKDVIPNGNLSVLELIQMAESLSETPADTLLASDIVDSCIRYGLRDIYKNRTGEHVIELEDIQRIVDYGISYGQPYGSSNLYIGYYDDLMLDNQLMILELGGDLQSYISHCREYNCEFTYVGHPSIYCSYHVINTKGQMAISSETSNGDVCWDFIKLLLSDDSQRFEVNQSSIPVNQNILEEYYDVAMNPEHDTDGLYFNVINHDEPATEDEIQSYREFIENVDTVVSYDWGIYSIICDEIYSYDLQGRSVEMIAESLLARLDLYCGEHYL